MIANSIRTCFPAAAQVVADKAEDINKLNVFPVPDGDTGTNMSLTLGTVVKEVNALPASATMADIAKAITHGSLMGARGNSGVITSQILRGVAEGLVPAKGPDATPADVAAALRNGVKVAFKAVRKRQGRLQGGAQARRRHHPHRAQGRLHQGGRARED